MFSERVNRITLSPTLRIGARAQQMRAQGIDLVDLTMGEPDFPTPEAVKRACKTAIDANFTKYTPNDGIPDLKQAIRDKLERDNQLSYSNDEIIVSPGAKTNLLNVALAIYGPGDDVLIPTPCWVSYPDQVRLAGANPVFVPTREEEGFRLQARDLSAAITPNTKALILNYPCNPTGAVYTKEELEEIAEVCVREQILVLADEIYEKLLYDGRRFVSIASLNPQIKKLTIVINGFSKAFSMTGWRLGYAAGRKEIIAACSKIQSHNTSNAVSFVQKAAIVALRDCAMDVERMRQEFERRRNFVTFKLNALPSVTCLSPEGAFYAFPNIGDYLNREFQGAPVRNSYGLAYYLLKEAHVALIPGDAFAAPDHLRLSFAASTERLEEGMRRMERALARLEPPRTQRAAALNNVVTKVQNYAEVRTAHGLEGRNALLAEAEAHLSPDSYFEWNAAIGGAVVQLRTNSPHLADFFLENFYPAPLESDLEPHAVVYAVKDIPGREPQGFASFDTGTAFAFNTAFYGQVRSLALAMAGESLGRSGGALLAHCACLDRDGAGLLVWGTGDSGRTALLSKALEAEGVRLVAADSLLVRQGAGGVVADLVERKLYLNAKWAEHFPEVDRLMERCKLENIVTRRDECAVEYCKDAETCPLDRGAAFCARASERGRLMLDPYWLGGAKRHVRRTRPVAAVLVVNDPVHPAVKEVPARDAARWFAEGQLPGGRGRSVPFLNPHLPPLDSARTDLVRHQHERLFGGLRVLMLNTAAGGPGAAAKRLLELLS